MILEKNKKIEENKREKAIAISAKRKGSDRDLAWQELEELAFLADTAGAGVVQKIYQELPKISSSTVIGSGKVAEVREIIDADGITLAIFDDDLTPAQVRNLEREFNIKVMDRSGIILDIFATRAKSNEAKTQVELAQLQYLLPRLTRMWTHLSKQYGGLGTRGPGETQIETDRRIIRLRIQHLKDKLDNIAVQKQQQRKGRDELPRFALVGYTNAGKSTLMNTLTDADVYVEDKLFATLDTTVRQFDLPSGQRALISDTVGFIRKLPTHLVASFRSTLAESIESDILMHVVDATNPNFRDQIDVVNSTLESLKIQDKPTILTFNKIDELEDLVGRKALEKEFPDSIFISAKRGINIENLLELMQSKYSRFNNFYELSIPYTESENIAKLYSNFEVKDRNDDDFGTIIKVKVPANKEMLFKNQYSKYFID